MTIFPSKKYLYCDHKQISDKLLGALSNIEFGWLQGSKFRY